MPDDTTTLAPIAVPAPTTPAPSEPLLNKEEIVELRKETRATRDLLKQLLDSGRVQQPAPAPPAPAPKSTAPADEHATRYQALEDRLIGMERNSALSSAFLKHGIVDTDAQDLIKAATASMQAADVDAFIAAKSVLFKSAGPKAPAPIAPGTSNTGAAGVEGRVVIPNDLLAIDDNAWKQLPPEEKRARYEQQKMRNGGNFNPFAAAKASKK